MAARGTRAWKDASIPEYGPIEHPDRPTRAAAAPARDVQRGPRRMSIEEFQEQHLKEVAST